MKIIKIQAQAQRVKSALADLSIIMHQTPLSLQDALAASRKLLAEEAALNAMLYEVKS